MATTQEINGMEIIKNTDIYIVYLAKFAVEEHNRKEVDQWSWLFPYSLILIEV